MPDIDMNYGWGDRIQLKYELPLAAATDQNNTTRAGLGESFSASSGGLMSTIARASQSPTRI